MPHRDNCLPNHAVHTWGTVIYRRGSWERSFDFHEVVEFSLANQTPHRSSAQKHACGTPYLIFPHAHRDRQTGWMFQWNRNRTYWRPFIMLSAKILFPFRFLYRAEQNLVSATYSTQNLRIRPTKFTSMNQIKILCCIFAANFRKSFVNTVEIVACPLCLYHGLRKRIFKLLSKRLLASLFTQQHLLNMLMIRHQLWRSMCGSIPRLYVFVRRNIFCARKYKYLLPKIYCVPGNIFNSPGFIFLLQNHFFVLEIIFCATEIFSTSPDFCFTARILVFAPRKHFYVPQKLKCIPRNFIYFPENI